MNTFLKTIIGVAAIAAPVSASYAAVPVLASKDACTAKAVCIADLSEFISTYDGLTEIKDLGGHIKTAQQLVYGNAPDGKVTRAEAVDPIVKFVFPSSRPELYRLEGYISTVKQETQVYDINDTVNWNAYFLRMNTENVKEFTAKGGAPSCTDVGSIPLRAHAPLTAEEISNGSLYGAFGGCRFQMMYDAAIRQNIEEGFLPYDLNKDGVISKADDRNKDNMITLEDTLMK